MPKHLGFFWSTAYSGHLAKQRLSYSALTQRCHQGEPVWWSPFEELISPCLLTSIISHKIIFPTEI